MVDVETDRKEPTAQRDRILDIVAQLLETEGYDAVQLREVARRARTSLATIYKRYTTRDELILAALQSWMNEHRYSGLVHQSTSPGESVYDGMMRLLRTIFEPWEQHPAMLTAFFRARAMLREAIARDSDFAVEEAFSFDGARCDRIVAAVLERSEHMPFDPPS